MFYKIYGDCISFFLYTLYKNILLKTANQPPDMQIKQCYE